ncbi:metallophosphoesterase [Clostridia bacterium]|nr:metallophosphoesterase [Clostridia bacterium]
MKVLMIGDVVGEGGCNFLCLKLPNIRRSKQLDLIVANGENSAAENGISHKSMRSLMNAGVDVITTGNHAFRNHQMEEMFEQCEFLLRPINFPPESPGHGFFVYDKGPFQVCVINVIGNVFMQTANGNPFEAIDKVLAQNQHKITLVDFHAEATGEKKAFAFHLDGRVSALVGTHTHVQTADEQILPKGTAYISDLGMVGAIVSVVGVSPESALSNRSPDSPIKHKTAGGPHEICGVILTIDEITGKASKIERFRQI